MIVQNVSVHDTGQTDISFTLPKEDGQRAVEALRAAQKDSGFESLIYDDHIGRLSVVGAGMRTNAGVSAQLFTALSDAGINIEMISTSEIRISVIMREEILADAVKPFTRRSASMVTSTPLCMRELVANGVCGSCWRHRPGGSGCPATPARAELPA
jgi:aspartokinase